MVNFLAPRAILIVCLIQACQESLAVLLTIAFINAFSNPIDLSLT